MSQLASKSETIANKRNFMKMLQGKIVPPSPLRETRMRKMKQVTLYVLFFVLFLNIKAFGQSVELLKGKFVVIEHYKHIGGDEFFFTERLIKPIKSSDRDSSTIVLGNTFFDNCHNLLFVPKNKRKAFYSLNNSNKTECDSFWKYNQIPPELKKMDSNKFVKYFSDEDNFVKVWSSQFYKKNASQDSLISIFYVVKGSFYFYNNYSFERYNNTSSIINDTYFKTGRKMTIYKNRYAIPYSLKSFRPLRRKDIAKYNLKKLGIRVIESGEGY